MGKQTIFRSCILQIEFIKQSYETQINDKKTEEVIKNNS